MSWWVTQTLNFRGRCSISQSLLCYRGLVGFSFMHQWMLHRKLFLAKNRSYIWHILCRVKVLFFWKYLNYICIRSLTSIDYCQIYSLGKYFIGKPFRFMAGFSPYTVSEIPQKRTVSVYSLANFVASWLKWLQILWNDSKWVSMCLINQLKSFEFI